MVQQVSCKTRTQTLECRQTAHVWLDLKDVFKSKVPNSELCFSLSANMVKTFEFCFFGGGFFSCSKVRVAFHSRCCRCAPCGSLFHFSIHSVPFHGIVLVRVSLVFFDFDFALRRSFWCQWRSADLWFISKWVQSIWKAKCESSSRFRWRSFPKCPLLQFTVNSAVKRLLTL